MPRDIASILASPGKWGTMRYINRRARRPSLLASLFIPSRNRRQRYACDNIAEQAIGLCFIVSAQHSLLKTRLITTGRWRRREYYEEVPAILLAAAWPKLRKSDVIASGINVKAPGNAIFIRAPVSIGATIASSTWPRLGVAGKM